MPRPMSAQALLYLGTALIVAAVVARFVLDDLVNAYAEYVGPGSSLEFSLVAHAADALNIVLMPLGAGFFCGAFVVAAVRHTNESVDHGEGR